MYYEALTVKIRESYLKTRQRGRLLKRRLPDMRFRLFFPILISSTIILLPLLLPLLAPDTPHEFDMFFHMERIAEFYKELAQHHIPPLWSTYLAFGFGSPVLMFNWSLPYYIASIALFWGTTLLESFKWVTAFTYIGSFISMFAFLFLLTSPLAALVGATWYVWSPYRFNLIHLRGAIGEASALVFWPGVFWATLSIFQKRYARGFFVGALLWALLLLSHQGLFLMILPIWFLLVLTDFYLTKNAKAAIITLFTMLMGIGLVSFFWIPAFFERQNLGYHYQETIYTQNYVQWIQLLSQPRIMEFGQQFGRMFYSIGWPLIGVLLISAFLAMRNLRHSFSNRIHSYRILFLLMAGLAITLVRPVSTILWDHIPLLSTIGYPQRFLGLMIFCVSVLAGLLTHTWSKRWSWVIPISMIGAIILLDFPFITLNTVRDTEKTLTVEVPDTTDVWGEFMPIDMPKDFITNGLVYAQQPIVTISPPSTITPTCQQTSVSITCLINTTQPAVVRLRQFYFPGWTAYADGVSLPATKHTDGTILLSFPKPTQTVEIAFTKTPLRIFSEFLTVIFTGLYIVLGVKTIYTYIRRKTTAA